MNEEQIIDMLINKIVVLKSELNDKDDLMYRISDYLLSHDIALTITNDKTISSRLDNITKSKKENK